jgi:hypothetical protein
MKNSDLSRSSAKGMTPIEKNIAVVDAFNNYYESTYIKRAKGLVKNGRAHFINATTICLKDPPKKLEVYNMSETSNGAIKYEEAEPKITISYLLKQIETIHQDDTHIREALDKLSDMISPGPDDGGTRGIAEAICKIVQSREATNQKLLDFYLRLYDEEKHK